MCSYHTYNEYNLSVCYITVNCDRCQRTVTTASVEVTNPSVECCGVTTPRNVVLAAVSMLTLTD